MLILQTLLLILLVMLLSQSWKPDSWEVREEFMMFLAELSASGLADLLLWKDPDRDLK